MLISSFDSVQVSPWEVVRLTLGSLKTQGTDETLRMYAAEKHDVI